MSTQTAIQTISRPDTEPDDTFDPAEHINPLLLHALLDPLMSIMNICEFRELSFDQLERIFESEEYAMLKQRIARLTRERRELIELDADPRALGTLISCTRIVLDDQPAIESARKAATRAKAIMNRNAKDRDQPTNQTTNQPTSNAHHHAHHHAHHIAQPQTQRRQLPADQHDPHTPNQHTPHEQQTLRAPPTPNQLPAGLSPSPPHQPHTCRPNAGLRPNRTTSPTTSQPSKRTTGPTAAQLVQHAGTMPATPTDPIPPPAPPHAINH